jgi:hypothetical protein
MMLIGIDPHKSTVGGDLCAIDTYNDAPVNQELRRIKNTIKATTPPTSTRGRPTNTTNSHPFVQSRPDPPASRVRAHSPRRIPP